MSRRVTVDLPARCSNLPGWSRGNAAASAKPLFNTLHPPAQPPPHRALGSNLAAPVEIRRWLLVSARLPDGLIGSTGRIRRWQ
ncbi:unnamed protein product [Prorocentrum cordatum]|uniref:Uncharacterized protein n=1 Tax=Prorocentrum cordatum TaxID=2364126 RepID=A0ABN9YG20_9DINO|nr:unnamed protein product [Polarella glacialis]